ncbi:gastrula zinc finger protein XlCGF26.1-like isoform X2 [Maniola hyperantus]|uniref:gastrula zinc finger protein XlCGF26.1-like isoform X2 n=1 Tax=Aphantopus hyperantus TaxID=2795564 RepID=UPI003749AE98
MHCCVPFCENTLNASADKSHSITFHKFPFKAIVCTAWLQAIGIQESQLPPGSVICSQHFLTDDFSVSRNGFKKIRLGAVPFVLYDKPLSDINQKPAHSDEIAKLEIGCGVSENVIIKNEGADELDENNETLIKQESLDPDWMETCDNIYDMHIDVFKEEIAGYRSETEHFSESYVCTSNTADVNCKEEIFESQKQQELSEHEKVKFYQGYNNNNMMLNIKLDHCESKPFLSADCAHTLGTTSLKQCTTSEDKSMDQISSVKENCFNQQSQRTLNKVKIFKRHIRKPTKTHSLKKPLPCDICDKKFYSKSKLNIHLRSHTGERPFSCDTCNFKSTRNSSLKKHMKTHSLEKSVPCDICEKKFYSKSNLNIHMRSHTGERPFSCHICNYKFTTNGTTSLKKCTTSEDKSMNKISTVKENDSNQQTQETLNKVKILKRHIRKPTKTHSLKKPFTCDICNKKFYSVLS